jgi:hypothetical protein
LKVKPARVGTLILAALLGLAFLTGWLRPGLSRTTTDSALAVELTHEIIPALQREAATRGDTKIPIEAARGLTSALLGK